MPKIADWIISNPLTPRAPTGIADAILGLRRGRGNTQSNQRKSVAKQSIRMFCDTYLKHHFYAPYGEHMADLFAAIERPAPPHKGKKVVRVEPRMHGKTTIISLALPLYCLAYKLKWFILMVGEGSGTSKQNLASLVTELEENELLIKDFPHLLPKRDGKNQIEKWTDEQIVVASGAMVWAKGMGSRMRGLKRGSKRPDLGIVDDPESPETCASFVTRIRHRKWFGGTFLGLGSSDWDIYVISNLPHHDCLVAHLLRSTEWDAKLYRALNIPKRDDERYPIGNTKHDGRPLWPDVWPRARLDAYQADPTVGALGFAREMMGDPRDEKDKPFDTKTFETFEWVGPAMLKEYRDFAIFIDPTGGEKPGELRKGRKDWAAIVFGGRHVNGFIDIFDIRMTRDLPDKQYDAVLNMYIGWSRLVTHVRIKIGAEENIAKNLIGPELVRRAREKGVFPTVIAQHQTHNKVMRILGTQPLIAAGTVRWRKDLLAKHATYFGQYDDFPGDHEDGPDATEALIKLLEKANVTGFPTGDAKTSYWRGGAVV